MREERNKKKTMIKYLKYMNNANVKKSSFSDRLNICPQREKREVNEIGSHAANV